MKLNIKWIRMSGDKLFLGAVAHVDVYDVDGRYVSKSMIFRNDPQTDTSAELERMGSEHGMAKVCGFVHENCCVIGAQYKDVTVILRTPLSDTEPETVSKCYTKTFKRALKMLRKGIKE